jgi:hypothetical protein
MGKVARNLNIAIVDDVASRGLETPYDMSFAIGLCVVLIAGQERTGAQWNSKNMIGWPLCVGLFAELSA